MLILATSWQVVVSYYATDYGSMVMNKRTLYIGAAVFVITAYIFTIPSHLSMGLGLMWMGIATDD